MKTIFILSTLFLSLSGFAQVAQQSFRATDGNTYYLHSDGKYYGTPNIVRNNRAYSNPQSFYATNGMYYGTPRVARSSRTYSNQRSFRATDGNTYYYHSDGNVYAYPERTQSRYYGEQRQQLRVSQPHYQQSCHRPQQFSSLNNVRQFYNYQQQPQVIQSGQPGQINLGSAEQKMLAKQKADYLAANSAARVIPVEWDINGRPTRTKVIGLAHPNFRKDLAGAGHEGVGFSTGSAQDAINRCCHSGDCVSAKGPGFQRLATAVSRGRNGWYACILTR